MGKLLSERDEQRLSRALPFIERMIRGPVSHSGETEVVVSQGQQWYQLTSTLIPGGTATARKLTSDLEYDAGVEEKTITDKLGYCGCVGDKIRVLKVGTDLVAASGGSLLYGVADAAIASGGHGIVSVWDKDASENYADTGLNVDAWATWILKTGSIAKDKRVIMRPVAGVMTAENWEC